MFKLSSHSFLSQNYFFLLLLTTDISCDAVVVEGSNKYESNDCGNCNWFSFGDVVNPYFSILDDWLKDLRESEDPVGPIVESKEPEFSHKKSK